MQLGNPSKTQDLDNKKIFSYSREGCKYTYWFEPKPSEELAYVLGALKGDGALIINEKNHHYFGRLRVASKEFAEEFSRCTKILGFNPITYVWRRKEGECHLNCVHICGKPFAYWCREMMPEKIGAFFQNDGEIRKFIKAFYESEGSYRENFGKHKNEAQMRIFSTDPNLQCLIYRWLVELGYKPRLRAKEPYIKKRKLIHIVSLYGEQARRFISDFNPCTKRGSVKGYLYYHPEVRASGFKEGCN